MRHTDGFPAGRGRLAECFFSVITRQAIRRGTFTSVKELVTAIGAFIDRWNDHLHPFTWTKEADQTLASIQRAKTKTSGPYVPLGALRDGSLSLPLAF